MRVLRYLASEHEHKLSRCCRYLSAIRQGTGNGAARLGESIHPDQLTIGESLSKIDELPRNLTRRARDHELHNGSQIAEIRRAVLAARTMLSEKTFCKCGVRHVSNLKHVARPLTFSNETKCLIFFLLFFFSFFFVLVCPRSAAHLDHVSHRRTVYFHGATVQSGDENALLSQDSCSQAFIVDRVQARNQLRGEGPDRVLVKQARFISDKTLQCHSVWVKVVCEKHRWIVKSSGCSDRADSDHIWMVHLDGIDDHRLVGGV